MLGPLIKSHIDEGGIKYSFVASKAGIPPNTFSVMLSGKRKISAEEYFAICAALNVEPTYFADKMRDSTTQPRAG